MKKPLVVSIFLLMVVSTYSQDKFRLTFVASPQVSWLASDSHEIGKGKGFLGFGYGVEGDFYLWNKNYSLTTGITVSTVGGSLDYRPSVNFGGKMLPAGTKVDYFIKNLEFPLALRMRTKDFNRSRFYAQFGLTNSINLKTKVSSSDGTFQKETVKDEVRFFNIALNVGAGMEYLLGHENALTCGIVYSNGFTDITSNSTISDATILKVLRFRMGFVF